MRGGIGMGKILFPWNLAKGVHIYFWRKPSQIKMYCLPLTYQELKRHLKKIPNFGKCVGFRRKAKPIVTNTTRLMLGNGVIRCNRWFIFLGVEGVSSNQGSGGRGMSVEVSWGRWHLTCRMRGSVTTWKEETAFQAEETATGRAKSIWHLFNSRWPSVYRQHKREDWSNYWENCLSPAFFPNCGNLAAEALL